MEKFIVKGEVQLAGSIRISGAKNAALPIMAAALLAPGVSVIHDVPRLRDIAVMQEILTLLGATVTRQDSTLLIDASIVREMPIPEYLMREMRASVFLLGPLLGKFNQVKLFYPGGCAIGPRPIDLHVKAMKRLGATVQESFGCIEARAQELRGCEINFDYPSVGATENAMLAAVQASGITIIRNAAREPEIHDLQVFLNKMGAKITGAGTDTIRIHGGKKLQAAEHTVMPDRIQAGTLCIAAAITGGDVLVENVMPEHVFSLIDKLKDMGVEVTAGKHSVRVKGRELRSADIKTLPYPGFPTDLQAPMLALLTLASGTSILTETIFENRFKHVDELIRMGAKIRVEGRTAIVRGMPRLTGAAVTATDLRAGGALVLAALAAAGVTEIHQVHHIDRGYEQLEEKLRSLGADIIRHNMD